MIGRIVMSDVGRVGLAVLVAMELGDAHRNQLDRAKVCVFTSLGLRCGSTIGILA